MGNLGLLCGPGLPAIGPVNSKVECKLSPAISDALPLTSAHAHVGAPVEAAEVAVEAVQVPDPDTPAVRLTPGTRRDGGEGARGGAARGG